MIQISSFCIRIGSWRKRFSYSKSYIFLSSYSYFSCSSWYSYIIVIYIISSKYIFHSITIVIFTIHLNVSNFNINWKISLSCISTKIYSYTVFIIYNNNPCIFSLVIIMFSSSCFIKCFCIYHYSYYIISRIQCYFSSIIKYRISISVILTIP